MMGKAGLDPLDEDGYASMCQALGSETSGLDLKAFIAFILKTTREQGEQAMYPILEKWGYDASLYSFEERPFILTIHTETQGMQLTMKDALNSGISNEITAMLIGSRGE
jgi:hypothetical protein